MNAKEKRRQTVDRQFRWHLCIILFCLLFLIGIVSITVLAADDYHVSVNGTVTVDGVRLTMVNAYDAGIESFGDIVVLNHTSAAVFQSGNDKGRGFDFLRGLYKCGRKRAVDFSAAFLRTFAL